MVDNTVKATLIKLHEYAHTKFKGNYNLSISPRYLFTDNLDCLDNEKILKDLDKIDNEEIIEYLGESWQAIERYMFGDEKK